MNGWERRSIKFAAGDQVRFQYQAHVESGSLRAELIAPDGAAVLHWGAEPAEAAVFTASLPGKYGVQVTADHASGGYRLELLPV
jgi:hypothetical protein